MSRVLLTGASGFVGRTLQGVLARSGRAVRAAVRDDRSLAPGAERLLVSDICAMTDWGAALDGVDVVVHAAARAHRLDDAPDDIEPYLATNAQATAHLVESAARAGVARFIYLSSIKVNGEQTVDRPFTPLDVPHPQGSYARSKQLGEEAVLKAGRGSSMQVAIVRPPLVYGPGVRANFLQLLRWIDRQRLLPIAAVHNRRSLVSVWNLCDLIARLVDGPLASGRIWMVSDGRDLSTPELVRQIARAMGRRARLVRVPEVLLHAVGSVTGRGAPVHRLCSSLTVDISATLAGLGWAPPVSVEEGLDRTVRWYLSEGPTHGA